MPVRWRHLPPNAITATSILFAVLAVMNAIEGDYALACWLILWCVVLDKIDGTLARLLKAGSKFGVEFDSVADFAAFGIAPALVFYVVLRNEYPEVYGDGPGLWLMGGAISFYVLAVGARLARFNVTTPVQGDRFFVGMPTTITGGLHAAFYLCCVEYNLPRELVQYFPIYLVVTALLMVSTLRLPKLVPRKNRLFNYFQLANFAAVVVCGILQRFPVYLFALAVVYAVVGFTYCAVTGAGRTPRSDPTPSG